MNFKQKSQQIPSMAIIIYVNYMGPKLLFEASHIQSQHIYIERNKYIYIYICINVYAYIIINMLGVLSRKQGH